MISVSQIKLMFYFINIGKYLENNIINKDYEKIRWGNLNKIVMLIIHFFSPITQDEV